MKRGKQGGERLNEMTKTQDRLNKTHTVDHKVGTPVGLRVTKQDYTKIPKQTGMEQNRWRDNDHRRKETRQYTI